MYLINLGSRIFIYVQVLLIYGCKAAHQFIVVPLYLKEFVPPFRNNSVKPVQVIANISLYFIFLSLRICLFIESNLFSVIVNIILDVFSAIMILINTIFLVVQCARKKLDGFGDFGFCGFGQFQGVISASADIF